MTTFAGWLNDQRKREDAVGWFARYWRDLPETPRLSAPSSFASHLEDRESHPGQDKAGNRLPYGFRDPDGGSYVRDAYDATLAEYRNVRAQIVQSVAGVPDDAPEQPAGPENRSQDVPGPAGQAVARATEAGKAAAAAHDNTSPGVTISSSRNTSYEPSQLDRIEAKLDGIRQHLGLASPAAASFVFAEQPIMSADWAAWFAQADLSAAAE